ncbi:hypothetical protein A2Z33_02240 [Candidatus Gottesmanbacteria bacterium RBG_16_52_11]|uniref:PEGA domain-containing protein n=1 Tax=Candidatus Gottesmanbacteria bacterium RBG_16_52_11 TaxID=1798374 RepID=A0A1F5YR51_9BACT|nr:MAG: hypothetical protein A2Z33_02240 [Candidatus Gottesmanbacteria bacterium RBG_16_52_11]
MHYNNDYGMPKNKIRDLLIPFITLVIILIASVSVISYGRGYRLNITQKAINPTGLIAATSDPTGAQVLIDGNLRTATNNTINVDPGWYTITIQKEGFQTWEKRLRVQGEVVTRADAYLFPTNPSLSTLSTNGIVNPVLSPDGTKLAYVIPESATSTASANLVRRAGIWIFDLAERPLGLNRDARQIVKNGIADFSDTVLTWSPDSEQILAAVAHPITKSVSYYLLESGRLNESPRLVTDIAALVSDWEIMTAQRETELLTGMPGVLAETIKTNMQILSFAPDETKILYQASVSATLPDIIVPALIGSNSIEQQRKIENGSVYVYDIKEDRNYLIGTDSDLGLIPEPTPTIARRQPAAVSPVRFRTYVRPLPVQWLPTSRHLLLLTKERIEAMDYDATNRKTIYAGPFWDGFMVPWMNASRVLILTTLNPAAGTPPNLYAVNLR